MSDTVKHTLEELQFAATVRARAMQLRDAARSQAKTERSKTLPVLPEPPVVAYNDAQKQEQDLAEKAGQLRRSETSLFAQDWDASNSVNDFIRPALAELEEAADLIAHIRG